MAQPLSQQEYNNLLSCLLNALNQNPEVQKQAEAYIQSLDSRPGFSSALAEIVSNREADHSARYLASVHLKNSVHRNWKKRTTHGGITPEEKIHLRAKLPQLIPQDDNQIAVQVALVYAKVARFDYPAEWPGLFADLVGNLSGGNTLTVRRVYLILHHVLKELSSKRLVADQANFAQVTELLFGHMWGQWCADTQLLLGGLPGGLETTVPPPQLLQSCERWMLLLKILRRLILHGFTSDLRSLTPVEAVHSCCPHMVAALQGLLDVRPRGRPLPRSHLGAMWERALLKLLKSLAQVVEVHPWSFHGAGALLSTMDICTQQLIEAAAAAPCNGGGGAGGTGGAGLERRLTQCCGLLVGVMSSKTYKGTGGGSLDSGTGQPKDTSRVKAMAAEVGAALQGFWASPPIHTGAAASGADGAHAGGAASSRLVALVGALVNRHIVLSKSDLESWRDGPEDWAAAAGPGSGGWQDSLALAAEQVYLVLLQAYREVLGPAVVALLPAVQAAAPAGTPADSLPGERLVGVPLQVLAKDAVYCALAAGSYELHDYLDFRGWLTGSLLQELGDVSAANKPIRRRIGLLVAANVDRVAEEDPVRPALYGAMCGLIAESDAAVSAAGIGALTALLGDFSFREEGFVGCLPGCLQVLLGRMAASEQLDSQKQAFGLLNLIIERCGDSLRPHVGALVGALPALWEAAAGQSLLQIQILEAVQRLLNLAGPESPALYPLVMPLLSYSLDLRQPEVLEGLLEDGLALWLVALRNAPTCCEPDPTATPSSASTPHTLSKAADAASAPPAPLCAAAPPLVLRLVPRSGCEGLVGALLAPLPALAAITEATTEHLPLVTSILSSAAMLAGPILYGSNWGPHVVAVLLAIVGNVSERGLLLTLPTLERMLQAAPTAAPAALQPVMVRLLGMMLRGKESNLVIANILPVLGRLLLASPQQFVALCGAAVAEPGVAAVLAGHVEGMPADLTPPEVLLVALLQLWTTEFDSLGQAAARRLCALGLCAVLALPSRALLGLLDVLLPPITAVWFETQGGGGGGLHDEGIPPSYDYFSSGYRGGEEGMEEVAGPALDSEEAEGESSRRAMLRDADPAVSLQVGAALRLGLSAASTLHGPALDAALTRLDEHLVNAVRTATSTASGVVAGTVGR